MGQISDEQFFGFIQEVIGRQNRITIDTDGERDTDTLVKQFREAYGIADHNSINGTDNIVKLPEYILCYDLMFLENPYEKKLRQRFFTFFSQDTILHRKRRVEKIYSTYLEYYQRHHIDTMLQISYCDVDGLGFSETTRNKLKEGVCLPFGQVGREEEESEIQYSPYYYIPITGDLLKAANYVKSQLNDTIDAFVEKDADDDALRDEIRNSIIPKIESSIDGFFRSYGCGNNTVLGEKDFVKRAISGYVCGSYGEDVDVFKNIIRVLLVNLWAVDGLRYLYFIPIPFLEGKRIGHMVVSSTKILDKKEMDKYVGLSFVMMNSLVQRNVSAILSARNFRESLKSAMSAIMSRNMSHNLGSHFISNTKNYFSSLIELDQDNEANYRGVKHALQYIQERMDFIATITSSDTYPFGAVNAKAQIFDELAYDDFYHRHGDKKAFNFLLDYLVLSEKISKQSWRGADSVLSEGQHRLVLQIGYWDGMKGTFPTYWDSSESNAAENATRDIILGINFAVPGGILGRHAIFSIVENIIRNAAKHGQDKIREGDFIVKLLYRTDERRLIIFDNKLDDGIDNTVALLNEKLRGLRFLDETGALAQENKGLKEMLICAIWLQNRNVAEVISKNDSGGREETEKEKDAKLLSFSEYLRVVAVDEGGVELEQGETEGYLGYSVKLDQYEKVHYFDSTPSYQALKNIKADIVCAREDFEIELNGTKKPLSKIFPRFITGSKERTPESLLEEIIGNNCGEDTIRKKMVISYTTKYNYDNSTDILHFHSSDRYDHAFLFKEHASKSKWDKFAALFLTPSFQDCYVDSISGGDFTYTLIQPSFIDNPYNLLKIKESIATRFVIIDERVFGHYKPGVELTFNKIQSIKDTIKRLRPKNPQEAWYKKLAEFVFLDNKVMGAGVYGAHKQELQRFVMDEELFSQFMEKDIEQHYMDRRGIYVFNLEACEDGFSLIDLSSKPRHFTWNKANGIDTPSKSFFHDSDKVTTFLSVHLGLIDKMKEQLLRIGADEKTVDGFIVKALEDFFGAQYVSIHSGRGGFDVRDSLKQYTFQSFSAIENPLYNSKYLLSQQFYNLSYYGTTVK